MNISVFKPTNITHGAFDEGKGTPKNGREHYISMRKVKSNFLLIEIVNQNEH